MTQSQRQLLFAAALLVGAAILAGCSAEKEAVSIDNSLAPDEVIGMVNRQADDIRTFSAEGSISVDSPRLSQSAGFQVDVKAPDSVKLVLSGPFGITVAEALVTKEWFTAYSALQNTVYSGSTHTKAGIMRAIDVPPSAIIDAFAGVRRFDGSEMYPDSFYVSGASYIVKFRSIDGWRNYTVDPRAHRIVRVETLNHGGTALAWREEYSYEQDADRGWVPTAADIYIPDSRTRISIEYSSAAYNRPVPEMSIACPADADRVTIE